MVKRELELLIVIRHFCYNPVVRYYHFHAKKQVCLNEISRFPVLHSTPTSEFYFSSATIKLSVVFLPFASYLPKTTFDMA